MDKNRPARNLDDAPLSPEEIKAIGEIELGPSKHEVFLNKHYKKLIFGGIAVMLAASAAVGYYSYKTQQGKDAGALIVQAVQAANAEGIPDPGSYDAKALAQVTDDYPDTSSAPMAELMEALSLLSDSAHAEAGVSRLEGMAANGENTIIRERAASALAAYYMGEKQDAKSAEYWQKVVAMPLNPYTAIAYISLGDMAKNAGDIESARNYYNQVKAVCPSSALAAEGVVGLRLALLGVDAPKEVQPPASEPRQNESQYAPLQQPAGDAAASPFGGFSTLPGSN